jgi:SAM-dependent methyltransferase
MADAYILTRCLACDGTDHAHYHSMSGYDLLRCRDCGFVFTRNVPSDQSLAQFYRSVGNQSTGPVRPKRNVLRRWKYRLFAAYLRSLPGRTGRTRLLEVGCSDGDLLEALHGDPRVAATGLDLSDRNVAFCRSQGFDADCCDLESANFPDDEFDTVVALHVVEHVQNPVRMLAEVGRVLRPGGHFFAAMPNIAHVKARLAGRRWKHFGPPGHLWYFSPHTLTKFLSRHGFRVIYASGLYHRAHLHVLARKPEGERQHSDRVAA